MQIRNKLQYEILKNTMEEVLYELASKIYGKKN